MHDLVVIGSGQSGLAAAHAARQRGLEPVVLEAGDAEGSWGRYYDSLRLFSPARFSSLPGMPFPGPPDAYPTRDAVVAYLRRYREWLGVELRRQHRAAAVDRAASSLVVRGAGFAVRARRVIVATGSFGNPVTPRIDGLAGFGGQVLHAAEYTSPDPFTGLRVAVVGAGSSAVQIAAELGRVAEVSLHTRRGIRWRRQRVLGQDVHWWLTRARLDVLGLPYVRGALPVIDVSGLRAAVDRRVSVLPMITSVDGDTVRLLDGRRRTIDALLFGTGYRPDLPFLAGWGLGPDGRPSHHAGLSTVDPRLGFVGLERQRTLASATLRGAGPDAEHLLRRLLQRSLDR